MKVLFQLNRQLGGSMPNCADGMNTAPSSRRSLRAASTSMFSTGHPGSVPNSRRSSAGSRPGSRRESFLINPHDSLDSNPGSSQPGYINATSLAATAAQPPGGFEDGGQAGLSAGQSLLQSIGAGVVGAASSFSTVTPPRYRKTFLRPYQHF